ncbi:MAG: Asp-tRNA(Asn)/Glu-tRNA(Gln) amidotransferase subunit GatC [Acidobacteriota bacterium]|nr:Asp-tRNA(Asn)/Glu-tRNA(Gln) amidotransferase subunit GatC [Blastocatellia bacterium]MDW8238461.1 Asp-tRNA(Asn)/Glu-tRNA(Gln) amidotransferase subunit GatC [Acidobacteriota bacterium]
MPITEQDVEKIAELANLELTAEEKKLFTVQLASIVQYIEKLNELETTDVPPMMHAGAEQEPDAAQRDDHVLPGLGQQGALQNAPDPWQGFFRVPKVIE